MGELEFQVGDRVRLREGVASVQGFLAEEIGEVIWVEPPSDVVGAYRVRVKLPGREVTMFDTDLQLAE
jgi:hypothetical protein